MPTDAPKSQLEVIIPIGNRILVRKEDDKKETKAGILLPDKMEIPNLICRVIEVSDAIKINGDYDIRQYDRVLVALGRAVPVEFELENKLYVIPIDDVVAVIRKSE